MLGGRPPLAITLTGSDIDGDPLTFAIKVGPADGVLSGTPPNVIYTPNQDANGSDSYSFTVSDGQGGTDVGVVTIVIRPVNDAPVAADRSVTAISGAPLAITLSAFDADDDVLSYSIQTPPTHGTLSGTGANAIYTSNAGYRGPDSFGFQASDGHGGIDTGVISIDVVGFGPG